MQSFIRFITPMFYMILVEIYLICSFHDSLSSMTRPRYFALSTRLMRSPLILSASGPIMLKSQSVSISINSLSKLTLFNCTTSSSGRDVGNRL